MSHDKFDVTEAEKMINQLQLPSETEIKSALSQAEQLRQKQRKRLEQFKQQEFIGTDTSSSDLTQEEGDAASSIKMTSQLEPLEVTINPYYLRKALQDAQIETQDIEMSQLIQVCIMLGESMRLAINNGRREIQASSAKVFNQIMDEIQSGLFETKD